MARAMMPLLLVDCYLDEPGAARNFLPHLGERPVTLVRTRRDPVPRAAAGHAALVVTGSGASVLEPPAWLGDLEDLVRDAARRGLPVLGVCFGHQAAVGALVGRDRVRRAARGELGWIEVERTGDDELLSGFPARFPSFASHSDEVAPDTPGLAVLARSADCPVQAYRLDGAPVWGVQFHLEMDADEARDLVERRAVEWGLDPRELLRSPGPAPGPFGPLMENFLALVSSRAAS